MKQWLSEHIPKAGLLRAWFRVHELKPYAALMVQALERTTRGVSRATANQQLESNCRNLEAGQF